MYWLAQNVDRESLRKYGFRKGNEWNGAEKIILLHERCDYWLFPLWENDLKDGIETIKYADKYNDTALWYIQIDSSGMFWINCTPYCYTYQIDNDDMDQMFYVLRKMILDGIVVDDYAEEVANDCNKQGITKEES